MERYRVFKSADQEGQSRWYHECERLKIPYIQVLERAKLAKVEWDYITLAVGSEKLIYAREGEVSTALVEIYRSVSNSRSSYYGSATVGHMDGIRIEHSDAAAAAIAGLFERVLATET